MTLNVIKILYSLVLIVLAIVSSYFSYKQCGNAIWCIMPYWTETTTTAIMAIAVAPFVYGLHILDNTLRKRNKNSTVILHVLACSLASTAITTAVCAAMFNSLHCYTEYIFMTSCLPYYWILPIFAWYVFVYYLADLSEIRLNAKLTSAYTSWVIFLAFTPFLAMFYNVFKLNVLGWQLMPSSGETLFKATIDSYMWTLSATALKAMMLSPFYVLFIPFLTRFEHTQHSS